jgi:hypothetical protein
MNHLSLTALMGFEEWKEVLNLLVQKVGLNTMFIPGLGLDDIPESRIMSRRVVASWSR